MPNKEADGWGKDAKELSVPKRLTFLDISKTSACSACKRYGVGQHFQIFIEGKCRL